jgi:hypothetical protein
MTLQNCWSWRLVRGSLVNADEIDPTFRGLTSVEAKLKRNKNALIVELNKAIEQRAAPFLPSTALGTLLRPLKLASALEIKSSGSAQELISELAKVEGVTAIEAADWIIAKAKQHEEQALKLELLRLKLKARIQEADSDVKLEALRREIKKL